MSSASGWLTACFHRLDEVKVPRGALGIGVLVSALTFAACGGGSDQLTRKQACAEYDNIVSQGLRSDADLASAFNDLADRTADADVADALRQIATGFQNHNADIPGGGLADLCSSP